MFDLFEAWKAAFTAVSAAKRERPKVRQQMISFFTIVSFEV
jgi:hypothetical protein